MQEAKLRDILMAGFQGALYVHKHLVSERMLKSRLRQHDACPTILAEVVRGRHALRRTSSRTTFS